MSNQAANRGTLKSLADLRCGSMSPIRSTESRMPVCDAIKLSMEPGSEAGLVRQLLSPDDPSTRDTVVKAGKSERYPIFRGILGYIRVNKTLTLQVQFRSRKSFFRKKDNSRIIPRSIVGPRKFERFLSEIISINSLFVQLEDIAKNKK